MDFNYSTEKKPLSLSFFHPYLMTEYKTNESVHDIICGFIDVMIRNTGRKGFEEVAPYVRCRCVRPDGPKVKYCEEKLLSGCVIVVKTYGHAGVKLCNISSVVSI